ncbi:LacI family DNA-binding transcriptional regulator [Microbacterium sp. NPDC090007]|uniref:LacI family DNA-binding transcriptional regulator n=1 Tax=Microbacterium sp. NPDC090007 TaxID=3364204 RepID=UPI00380E3C2C
MTHEHETATPAATPRPRARLIDVATAAGVSPKTVSRVINDEAGVLPPTRERVRRAVRELGFVPDRSARELKRRDADTVGILIDAISDPFFAAFVSVIEELAVAEGLSVIFASTGYDAAREVVQLDRLTGHRLRGLIVAPVAVSVSTLGGLRTRFPVVCIDRVRSGIDAVVIDDFGAAAEATSALIAHGHRRVAFMGEDVPYPTVSDRLAGYRSALAAAGLPFDPSLVVTNERFGRGEAAEASRLLERDDAPTALLCATSLAAIGTVRAIRSKGLRMPALISFGDFTLAEVLEPGITYVDHDPRLMATAAFGLLRERAVRPEQGPERIVVPTRLVARGSGEVSAPSPDPDGRDGFGRNALIDPHPVHLSGSATSSPAPREELSSLSALTEPAPALVAIALAPVHPEPVGDVAASAVVPLGAPS